MTTFLTATTDTAGTASLIPTLGIVVVFFLVFYYLKSFQFLFALYGENFIVIGLFGGNVVKIKYGNENDCRKTCIEAAIVKNESAVHCRS